MNTTKETTMNAKNWAFHTWAKTYIFTNKDEAKRKHAELDRLGFRPCSIFEFYGKVGN